MHLSPMQQTCHQDLLKAQHLLLGTGPCTSWLKTAAAAACTQPHMSRHAPSAISLQLAQGTLRFLWSFSQCQYQLVWHRQSAALHEPHKGSCSVNNLQQS